LIVGSNRGLGCLTGYYDATTKVLYDLAHEAIAEEADQ
jgi:hypothetical protein